MHSHVGTFAVLVASRSGCMTSAIRLNGARREEGLFVGFVAVAREQHGQGPNRDAHPEYVVERYT